MDSISNWITPELTSSLASRFGIPADTVNSTLHTSSATMLTTLASKAQDTGFLGSVYQQITGSGAAAAAAAAAGTTTAASQSEAGSSFLSTLFGSSLPAVESKIAQTANIPVPASGAILAAAAPLVLGTLANKINAGGWSVAALGSTLAAELPSFKSYLPGGFAIPGLAGVGNIGTAASDAASSAASTASRAASKTANETKSAAAGWLWPVVLVGALLIAALIWYFSRGKETVTDTAAQATSAVADTATKVGDATQNALSALGAFFKRKLPDGVELNIPENGIENKLIAFIEDKSKPVDTETWFDFDRLLFATGSATLQPSSSEQLQNIAAILKAYPNVHLRIGGYTDNTGSAEANLKLSQDRASTVMSQLVSLGIDPSRLDAKGYGEEHPVADNATEAGRAQNRRISVRVTQK
jgi:outer membrane protein OmpA-like peptidoglycan-associated protein